MLATVTDANYGRFALFALCTKGFKATGAAFGEPQFSTFLEREPNAVENNPRGRRDPPLLRVAHNVFILRIGPDLNTRPKSTMKFTYYVYADA